MNLVCPFHADGEDVQSFALDGSLWQYTCTRQQGHPEPGPFTWQSAATDPHLDGAGGGGIAEELGLYDSLVAAVDESATWVEYGVIEYRFAQNDPDLFSELLARYGHKHLARSPFNTSMLLGGSLGRLAARGDLVYHAGRGSGYWSYNQPSSYYVRYPDPAKELPPTTQLETYADFAAALGQDPQSVAWWPGVWSAN